MVGGWGSAPEKRIGPWTFASLVTSCCMAFSGVFQGPPLLESLAVSEDVRPLLASAFQLRKLVERAPSLAPASFLA